MEIVRSRSESPFTKRKMKEHENGTEIGKGKKKVIKNKQKSQQNDLDSEDSRTSEKDEIEEAGIENGHEDDKEVANNNDLINNCESEKYVTNGDCNEANENGAPDESSELAEEEKDIITETENCAKNEPPQDDLSQNGETVKEEADKATNGETDNITQPEEDAEVGSTVKGTSEQLSSNGSENGSNYEDAHSTKEEFLLSPDRTSLSDKLTRFWGKWNSPSQEEKKDMETSTSKKMEGPIFNHPYLSKVSGRKGIKERLNSSATVFELRDECRRTPEKSELNLNDSFRVRTNPPRINSSEMIENPTLKKYKGKRCLNANDEPEEVEEEDADIVSSSKRRKLDNGEEYGLLGGLLWSPFKKKSVENENDSKLSSPESKLSRFLSPFWFWKKLAARQK